MLKKYFLLFLILCSNFTLATPGHDYSKIVGPGSCVSCHQAEAKVWQNSKHHKLFKKFHKRKNAKVIAKKMGIKRIKKKSMCMDCHYTVTEEYKVISGVSCESCHSPSLEWISVHNDYGNEGVTKETESAAHKKQRIQNAKNSGMTHPSDLYGLAKNCLSCHGVHNEELIEIGGHKQPSYWEFVTYSQGEMRHNYSKGKGVANVESPPKRKRQMYIIGRATDLEMGLRGIAKVKKKTQYAITLAKRTKKALGHLGLVLKKKEIKIIREIYQIGKAAKLKPNNEKDLLSKAEKISKLIVKFLNKSHSMNLSSIDSLIPKIYKGTPVK